MSDADPEHESDERQDVRLSVLRPLSLLPLLTVLLLIGVVIGWIVR